jgi:hypothetical protein
MSRFASLARRAVVRLCRPWHQPKHVRCQPGGGVGRYFETLEERAMLSIGTAATVECLHVFYDSSNGGATLVAPQGTTSPSGLAPDAVRSAYGIDSIVLDGIEGDGTGQTIAIVAAYDNPNFVSSTDSGFASSDLARFDDYFGLDDPARFVKLDQNGGTDYPEANTSWATEIALDVEWAHAIAPAANIVLVEADSASLADIWTAIDTARNLDGVSVVSMSFGLEEFSGELAYDATFATPGGHTGVTFVAASGDNGSPGLYPAYSSNVIAVGGTTLTQSDGTYVSETAWSGSGGGQSSYLTQPDYQDGVQSSGYRQSPDVAFDAAPTTGVAVYDSYGQSSSRPWITVGGTSLSAPCWAGLIAIANQLRVEQGYSSLDGASEALPALYSLSLTTYNDVTSGSNGGYSAAAGYDMVTGLGSPQADALIPALALWGIDSAPQVSTLSAADVTQIGATSYTFTVTYADDVGIDISSLDNNDIRVTGPDGYDELATLVSVSSSTDGSPRVATYSITPPGGVWDSGDSGTYTIAIEADQVTDTEGTAVPAATLGSFNASIGILLVDERAAGLNTGTSWANAYTDLQDALDAASAGDQIWVAAGTYTPTSGTDRSVSFVLASGVAIYGGFAGNETSLAQRDAAANVTTLSGDIGAMGYTSDNSYHVVYASGVTDAVLDGVTITAGNASGSTGNAGQGGGVLCLAASTLSLSNCTITANSARYAGAGMSVDSSTPVLLDCTFSSNSVAAGGGLYSYDSTPSLTNVIFTSNSATAYHGGAMFNFSSHATLTNVLFAGNVAVNGGGLYNYDSSPSLTNVTFTGNTATGSGGAMADAVSSTPALVNCILWGDVAGSAAEIYDDATSASTVSYSIVAGGWTGTANLDSDPLLDADGRLGAGSPAIDAGTSSVSVAYDLDNLARPQDGDADGTASYDLGAYEYDGPPTVTAIALNDMQLIDVDCGAAAFTVAVTYNEPMDTETAPTITFSESLAATLTLTGGAWSNDGYTYAASYDVMDADVEYTGIDITLSGASDLVGTAQTAHTKTDAFDVDTLNPTVTKVLLSDTLLTDGDLGTQFSLTLTYSEAMDRSVDPTIAFTADVAGSLRAVAGSWLSSTRYLQTYQLLDANVVVDRVGIRVSGALETTTNPQTVCTASDLFAINTKNLVVESIARSDSQTTCAASVEFVVTFSAGAWGVDMNDFQTSGVDGAAVTGVSGSGRVYRVTVSTGSGSGTLALDLIDDDSIVDASSEPLGGVGARNGDFAAGENYLVDRTAPSVVAFDKLDADPTSETTLHFSITFSEAVTGVDVDDFVIVAPHLSATEVVSVTGSGTSYVVTVNRGAGSGTLQLDLADDDSIVDTLGNPLGGEGEANGYVSGPRYTIQAATSLLGLFDASTSTFYLSLDNTTGADVTSFAYGVAGADFDVFVGDWDGDGITGVGLYDASTSTFYLTNASTTGSAEHAFSYGVANDGWIPLVGDWNGDGTCGVGLYDPHSSTFYLTDTLATGYAKITFAYGVANGGWTPLVGDWNGDGAAGVGLYDSSSSMFYLTSTLQTGFAEHTFGYGEPNAGWTPLVGDWDGNGSTDVGLYAPQSSLFYLTTTFATGYAQSTFGYGAANAGWTPIVGDWDGDGTAGVGLYDASSATFYLTNTLDQGYAEQTVVFETAGADWQPLVGVWNGTSLAAAVDQLDLTSVAAQDTELDLTRLATAQSEAVQAVDVALLSL